MKVPLKIFIDNDKSLFIFTFPYQALECDLLNEFLSILDSPLQEVESPSACKALIVKAVKAMQCSLMYGEQISAILKDSQVCMLPYYTSNMNNLHNLFAIFYIQILKGYKLLCFIGLAAVRNAKA